MPEQTDEGREAEQQDERTERWGIWWLASYEDTNQAAESEQAG
jgi:hypothetical protein